ncbi:hypothetical protein BKA80DRAFT_307977 [Phyllosticta citrichinensis]
MSGSNNNSRRNSSHSYQGDPPPYGWERDPPPGYYSRGAYFGRPPPYRGQYPAISEPPGSRRQQSFQNWPFPPPRSTADNRRQQAYQDWQTATLDQYKGFSIVKKTQPVANASADATSRHSILILKAVPER